MAILRTGVFADPFALLNELSLLGNAQSYPPNDIIKLDANNFVISLAVAGYSNENLEVKFLGNILTVSGNRENDVYGEFLSKGISSKSFKKEYRLPPHLKVIDATYRNGLLDIYLQLEDIQDKSTVLKIRDTVEPPKKPDLELLNEEHLKDRLNFKRI